MSAGVTETYSRMHRALADVARDRRLVPHDVRVVLALGERGGVATSQELADDLWSEGSAVRRSLLTLYRRGLAMGFGRDGGPRRPGQVTRVELTDRGRDVVAQVRRHIVPEPVAEVA